MKSHHAYKSFVKSKLTNIHANSGDLINQPKNTAMTTPSNTAKNSEQEIPSLKNLLGFDIPKLTRHYSDTITYTVDCDAKALDDLKGAAEVASMIIHDGIEAISNLLLTIELNCPTEINRFSKIHALALIVELSGTLCSISNMEFVLDKAEAVNVAGAA